LIVRLQLSVFIMCICTIKRIIMPRPRKKDAVAVTRPIEFMSPGGYP
jgi:hypothetical protein